MLWYEEETFEDCAQDLAPDQCSDRWQPALPRPLASQERCEALRFEYNKRAGEEFQCALERPPARRDDTKSD